jgi:hypothetical protein
MKPGPHYTLIQMKQNWIEVVYKMRLCKIALKDLREKSFVINSYKIFHHQYTSTNFFQITLRSYAIFPYQF